MYIFIRFYIFIFVYFIFFFFVKKVNISSPFCNFLKFF